MELGWPVDDVLPNVVTKFDQESLVKLGTILSAQHFYSSYRRRGLPEPPKTPAEKVRFIIDNLGRRSGRAQGLGKAITTFDRVNFGGDSQIVYILREPDETKPENPAEETEKNLESERTKIKICSKILGFIKVGYKPLFVIDAHGNQFESRPLCILDFYVVEEMQRRGCGRKLFDFMVSDLRVRPGQLAIDRPSPKFKNFLRKHYGLAHTIPQVNNFVIFDSFFRFNNPKRNRNRLTDDFSDRRRYQRFVRNGNAATKSALPRIPDAKKVAEPEAAVKSKSEMDQPISINRNHVTTDQPLLNKRRPVGEKLTPAVQAAPTDENYAAYLNQWNPRNNLRNPRHRANHAFQSRHYSRHNSAFNIFGRVDKHH